MRRLETEWESYRNEVLIPQGFTAVQLDECKRAFYAGAAALHSVVMTMLDPGTEATNRDLENMVALHDELTEFGVSQGMRRPT